MSEFDSALARYSRQMLFEPFGVAGQKRLIHSQVALIGCGALGTVLASTLVRAGTTPARRNADLEPAPTASGTPARTGPRGTPRP